ncbi:MAG: hypothetical protein KUG68_01550 [Flavobacteriaceae bacterium]|nr:hypothetical protein [Flavobacteriaceae bacterium]
MTKKYSSKKYGVLLVSMLSMFIFSCNSDDESTPLLADLILNEIHVESGGETIITEFAEDGRPISASNRSFSYDNNNQLIEEVKENDWFTLPTNYSYNNDVLVSYDYSVIASSDGVSQVHVEVAYNDNIVTLTAFHENEFSGSLTYTFMSPDYKYLIKKETNLVSEPSTPDKIYEYEYDIDFNLISVDESEINPNTGTIELIYNYIFEYDDKKNPFELFSNHNAIVFGFFRFSFDNELFSFETAINPIVRRSGNHNITKVSRVDVNGGNTSVWDYDYVYNSSDFPTKKKRTNDDGLVIFEIDFSYY